MIIGIVGRNGAGKDEVARILEAKGFAILALSDALRKEADNRGLDHSRTNLIDIASELRTNEGTGVLVKNLTDKIKQLQQKGNQQILLTSLRNPGEIQELRSFEDFVLLGIHAASSVRFDRLKGGERVDSPNDYGTFLAQEKYEEDHPDPTKNQIGKCLEQVDFLIENNETRELLEAQVHSLLSQIEAERKKQQ